MRLLHSELPILEYDTLVHHAHGKCCTNLAAILDAGYPIRENRVLLTHNFCLLLEMSSILKISNIPWETKQRMSLE